VKWDNHVKAMILHENCDCRAMLSFAVAMASPKVVVIGAVSIAGLIVGGMAWLRSWLTIWRRADAGAAELSFHAAAQAAPAILWAARPDGSVDFISDQLYSYSGLTQEQAKDWGWMQALHPDDLGVCTESWERSLRDGSPFEIEYRLRRADGGYRWFLVRGNPLRDEQRRIVKWIGTCTDVEDQKHHQQILEQQIRERTEELADANTRLQEEMWERDSARRELDQQNERMLRELTERSQRATLLAKMGEVMQSCVAKEEVFAAALGFAPKIFPARRGAVVLLNDRRDLAEIVGSWHDCQLPEKVFEPHRCWALRTGHPHLVVAGDTTAPCAHAAGVKNTYLCIPILAQGEALGILHFQATDEAPTLADSELSFKTTFAGQVGLSVANIRLREALRTQSIKDTLTGLYNRRYLEEMLEREIRRAVRAEQALGLLMLDLDHFKKFNDTYGHDAGDTVLRESATFLAKSIRAEDIVCRFGGEEFVVILPTANLNASCARAERIRSRLRELTVLHQGQSLGMVTVSVGVAVLPEHGTSPKELLEAADAALYRAKRDGRDRVVAAELPQTPEPNLPAIGMSAR
jgi:diguanylate cyclase (GGDEF)-like protein/PAS domain S-box-containing protein